MALGAPTKYNNEIANKICDTISTSSKSLRIIAKENNISLQSILNWLREHEDFLAQYTRARDAQADYLSDEMIEIADDGANDLMAIETKDGAIMVENKEITNRSKLRIETRKWIASKLKPKKYGDKSEVDITTKGDKITTPIITAIVDGKIIDGTVK